jgi:cytochrome c oxidase subunit 3
MLIVTILFGFIFMVNKYFEWTAKIHHGIYPGGPELLSMSDGGMLFFNLYYVMTGLHGIHVLVGIIVLSVMLVFVIRKTKSVAIQLENSGLYWHLVDIIWIFLFPLFYLIS